jgi:hypothetical protein
MIPRKSLTLKFPEFLKEHPLVNHFIRGFFDGDGCIIYRKGKTTNRLHFSIVGTLNMIENIMNIFYKKLQIRPRKIYSSKISPVFNLFVDHKNDILKVQKFLYENATIFLERKKKIFDNYSNDKFGDITSKKRGICFRKSTNKWRAYYYDFNWKRIDKSFNTENEAIDHLNNLPINYHIHKPSSNEL